MRAEDLLLRGGMNELNEIAAREIQRGWEVLTSDEEQVGTVDDVGDVSFTVAGLAGSGGVLEIAFGDVESADDGRVILALSRDELMPAVETS